MRQGDVQAWGVLCKEETTEVHALQLSEMAALAEAQRGLVAIMNHKQTTTQRSLHECEEEA